jgi:hypothetical protein
MKQVMASVLPSRAPDRSAQNHPPRFGKDNEVPKKRMLDAKTKPSERQT